MEVRGLVTVAPAALPHAGKGPAALMLAPTRELALQIAAVLEEAGEKVGLRTLCVYGGVPKPPQAAALRKGVEIVVATPGRLEDLLADGALRWARAARPLGARRQDCLSSLGRPVKPREDRAPLRGMTGMTTMCCGAVLRPTLWQC